MTKKKQNKNLPVVLDIESLLSCHKVSLLNDGGRTALHNILVEIKSGQALYVATNGHVMVFSKIATTMTDITFSVPAIIIKHFGITKKTQGFLTIQKIEGTEFEYVIKFENRQTGVTMTYKFEADPKSFLDFRKVTNEIFNSDLTNTKKGTPVPEMRFSLRYYQLIKQCASYLSPYKVDSLIMTFKANDRPIAMTLQKDTTEVKDSKVKRSFGGVLMPMRF